MIGQIIRGRSLPEGSRVPVKEILLQLLVVVPLQVFVVVEVGHVVFGLEDSAVKCLLIINIQISGRSLIIG